MSYFAHRLRNNIKPYWTSGNPLESHYAAQYHYVHHNTHRTKLLCGGGGAGIKLMALFMIGKHSILELNPNPFFNFNFFFFEMEAC